MNDYDKNDHYPVVYIKELEMYGVIIGDSEERFFRVLYPAYKDDYGSWYVVIKKETWSTSDKIRFMQRWFDKEELSFNVV